MPAPVREPGATRGQPRAGPPQRLGERVVRATPVPRAPVEGLLAALGLGVQAGLDPDPDNAVAVATFTCAPPGQPAQQVGPAPPARAATQLVCALPGAGPPAERGARGAGALHGARGGRKDAAAAVPGPPRAVCVPLPWCSAAAALTAGPAQVTVASPDATVTAALKDLICQLLASM